jgi:hypothetical protein
MLQHHQPKHDPERIWVDNLEPKVKGLRTELRRLPLDDIARRSGATLDGGRLRMAMLFDDYEIDTTDYVVSRSDGGEVNSFLQSLVLTYLGTADGGPPAERWVTFRDLPSGSFYNQAFQGYGPDRLAKRWQLDIGGFVAACGSQGGTPIDHGDAGFVFTVLPRVDIAAIYWQGDEDFPSKASVLFDANAHYYMVIDGLAILGSRLVDSILAED